MKKKKGNEDPLALAKLAEKALQEAVYEAYKDHERTGDPVAIWQNGKVVKIQVSRLHLKEPAAIYRGKKRSKK